MYDMKQNVYLNYDLQNELYYKFLDLAFDVCDQFMFIVRKGNSLNYKGLSLIVDLEDSFIEKKEQNEWIGTWSDEFVDVYYYKTTDSAKKTLKKYSNSLHTWIHPDLPEDLCFVKRGKPWLINVSHEELSSVNANEEEIDAMIEMELDIEVR